MNLQAINASASPEVQINENFESIDWASVYGNDQPNTAGLVWGYYGGRWGGFSITAGTLTLTNSADNYVSVNRSTGAVSNEGLATGSPTLSPTNWNDATNYARVYKLTTSGGMVTAAEDHRAGPYGVFGYPYARRQNSKSADYTLVLADAEVDMLHPSADTTARAFTIPANSSVPYAIGTELNFINQNGAGVLSIPITTDTMRLAGAGTTGTRSLAANGIAKAKKITATEWIISGTGLT